MKRRHKQHLRYNSTPFDQIINKENKDKFKFEVIEKTEKEKMDEREIYWIDYFNTFRGKGYNNTPGGDGTYGKDHPGTVIKDSQMAINIRNDYEKGDLSYLEICDKYNISKNTLFRILNSDHWSTEGLKPIKRSISTKKALKIYNYSKINDISSYRDLVETFDISDGVAANIIKAKRADLSHLDPLELDYENPKGENHPSTKISKNICLNIYNEYKSKKFKNQSQSKEFFDYYSNKLGVSVKTIREIILADHWSTKHLTPLKRFYWNKDKSLKIYFDYKTGKFTQKEISVKHNVSENSVRRIVNCNHRHTEDLVPIDRDYTLTGEDNPWSKFSLEKGIEIYELYKKGNFSIKQLSKKFDLSTETIRQIVYGNHWSTSDLPSLRKDKKPKTATLITEELALKVYNSNKNEEYTKKELVEVFNLSKTSVNIITNAKHRYTKHLSPLNNRIDKSTVLSIYEDYKLGDFTQKELANIYNVGEISVYRIIKCKQRFTKNLKPL